jgi:hypothetical protein
MVTKNFTAQVERNFTSYPVGDEQDKAMQDIREGCRVLGMLLDVKCPDSREKSLAVTNLEQVMFWANAAIARPND